MDLNLDSGWALAALSAFFTTAFGVGSLLFTRWLDRRHKQAETDGKTTSDVALRRMDHAETVRVELSKEIRGLRRMVDRQDRAFYTLRQSIVTSLNETMMVMQLAVIDLQNDRTVEAEQRLLAGIAHVKGFELPQLPPLDPDDF